MGEIYFGKGNDEQFDEYMDFINYVFGFNGKEQDFKKLLPKLYRRELAPAEKSYITAEDDRIKAAVGVFKHEVQVCNTQLRCAGIGNVAVHPYQRSKGYMKTLMNMALDDMIKEGIDFTVLGGMRQRYNYFSFENAGICYNFQVSKNNIRHTVGNVAAPYGIEKVMSDDKKALDAIARISASQLYAAVRDGEELYAILCSWRAQPYLIKDKETIIGYFVLNQDKITEILLEDDDHFAGAIHAIMSGDAIGRETVSFMLPPFQPGYIQIIETIAGKVYIEHCKMFSILRFRKVTEAFMRLKSGYVRLPDGKLSVLVHGRAGDESFVITVENGAVSIGDAVGETDIELDHLEAMRYFYNPVSSLREKAPHFVRSWFPLPIWIYSADSV